ncbi:MAG: hypothetical protein AAGJ56_05485 [Myxococcota bacterium]
MRLKWVVVAVGFAGLLGAATRASGAAKLAPSDPPVAVFAELDGRWQGEFVGYSAQGKELYRISVEQRYRTIDSTTQLVEIVDRDAEGRVTTGEGRNVATRRADGALELSCRVEKSNGETVEHRGALVTAADGSQQLMWFSTTPSRREVFREHVHGTGSRAVYEIHGTGIYDGTLIVMHGAYRRVTTDSKGSKR